MMKRLTNKLLEKTIPTSLPRKRESRKPSKDWIPASAGMTSCESKGLFQQPVKSLKSNSKILRTTNYLPSPKRFVQAGELKTISSTGFTLIEIVVVIVILSIVSAITIYFLVSSLRVYTMTVNQKTLFDEGKLALERMCRDIRDANSITLPAAGGSGSSITFVRTNPTAQDSASENITFQLTGTNLEKVKTSPAATSTIAGNVSAFTVTRGADDEIKMVLTLSLGTGENVTLQTKVYPKNLPKSANYKNFFQNWQEEISS